MSREHDRSPPRRQPVTYSIDETAQLFGVSTRTVQREIAKHNIKSLLIGRRRLIPQTELDRILGGKQWRAGGAA